MIQFTRLRLSGFKSFVEKTEVEIGPGLTGIVGPNGCGKSNVVEALRWSMGESSSKRMRGGSGSMDDVIFNGTEQRASRNTAEVSVILDNTARTAPAPFNNFDEIEVVRRIERDHGSQYRINGKNVRARDVQLLYADLLSGANSPYLVSQGKINSMIQAKPLERRQYLEEAAGISGLYARRHEAELRLRATENNLQRLDDQIGGMEERLNALTKQAKQAQRYRKLNAEIRGLEVAIACLEWRQIKSDQIKIQKDYAIADSAVAEHMITVSQLTKTQNTQSQDLPDLRKRDAELSAAIQTLRLSLQRIEDENERLENEIRESERQIEQIKSDRSHEQKSLAENTNLLESLDLENERLQKNQENEDRDLTEKEDIKKSLYDQADKIEARYTELKEQTASDRTRKESVEHALRQSRNRLESLTERLETLTSSLADTRADQDPENDTDALQKEIVTLEENTETLRSKIENFDEQVNEMRSEREDKQRGLQDLENQNSKLLTEISTLETFLNTFSEENVETVLEKITTEKGFETALSRALGDSLMASQDETAKVIWQEIDLSQMDLPALPDGAQALAPHVKAPSVLQAALSQIGMVQTDEDGAALAKKLKPGQSLVTPQGAYWRWDGLHMKEQAADRHTEQLKQKNRLQDLLKQTPPLTQALEQAKKALEIFDETEEALRKQLQDLRATLQEQEMELRQKRSRREQIIQDQSEHQVKIAKLEEAKTLAEADIQSTKEQVAENEKSLKSFDEKAIEDKQKQIEDTHQQLQDIREKLQDAIRDFEIARQEQSRRKARLRAIADERVTLQNRCIRSRERLKELDERQEDLQKKVTELKARPKSIESEQETLAEKIKVNEQEKFTVSEKLAICENELGETTKALKEAEATLSNAREKRAGMQATADERQRQLGDIARRIGEQFDMTPEELSGHCSIDLENPPALEELKSNRESSVRSRDMIGPVNLRAEDEATELEKELMTILDEKNDLTEAVNELRQGIQKLNKEARERLQIAFAQINNHFRELFTRLFNGGKAHLALIDSDDPLEAGLEIFAQPPGKVLQSLSLLSGGEQTLTAIALLFAMFRTNSAPICVLDEVDAPLDDANVDRVCDLLEEFADGGSTRFLIITHHRLTMARMDRLYGVTMAEKGISQLVSVDLNKQLELLENAA